jgi:Ser/Thr protein kinase RdoA (MazF antagonist)
MMRLSTLWKVDRTLDAAGWSPLADRIAERWEHDEDTLRFVRSSANFVYRFRANGAEWFLRFADSCERTWGMIEGEIDLLEWLGRSGLTVSRPVRSKAGNLVETVDTSIGTFYAVAFARLPGSHLTIGELDRQRFHDWGAALGGLHANLAEYSDRALMSRATWREQLDQARVAIPSDKVAVWHELDEIAATLEALPVDRERCGLIHGDFELDNLCWTDQTASAPGILDFDDCSQHWYAADLAFALRDLFDNGADLSHESVDAFIRGYRVHYPLDDKLMAALPLFSRLSRLLTYAKLVRSLDLPADSDQPAWLDGLRQKFEATTAAYATSLI